MVTEALHADLPVLAQIHAQAFAKPWDFEALKTSLEDPQREVLAARIGVHCGGFVILQVAADQAEILTIAVAPEFRRKGLGRSLVRAAEASARKRSARSLWLDVSADNRAACLLYDTLGYKEDGRRKGYYSGSDAVLLSRRLD